MSASVGKRRKLCDSGPVPDTMLLCDPPLFAVELFSQIVNRLSFGTLIRLEATCKAWLYWLPLVMTSIPLPRERVVGREDRFVGDVAKFKRWARAHTTEIRGVVHEYPSKRGHYQSFRLPASSPPLHLPNVRHIVHAVPSASFVFLVPTLDLSSKLVVLSLRLEPWLTATVRNDVCRLLSDMKALRHLEIWIDVFNPWDLSVHPLDALLTITFGLADKPVFWELPVSPEALTMSKFFVRQPRSIGKPFDDNRDCDAANTARAQSQRIVPLWVCAATRNLGDYLQRANTERWPTALWPPGDILGGPAWQPRDFWELVAWSPYDFLEPIVMGRKKAAAKLMPKLTTYQRNLLLRNFIMTCEGEPSYMDWYKFGATEYVEAEVPVDIPLLRRKDVKVFEKAYAESYQCFASADFKDYIEQTSIIRHERECNCDLDSDRSEECALSSHSESEESDDCHLFFDVDDDDDDDYDDDYEEPFFL